MADGIPPYGQVHPLRVSLPIKYKATYAGHGTDKQKSSTDFAKSQELVQRVSVIRGNMSCKD